jgi:hypothetical protein
MHRTIRRTLSQYWKHHRWLAAAVLIANAACVAETGDAPGGGDVANQTPEQSALTLGQHVYPLYAYLPDGQTGLDRYKMRVAIAYYSPGTEPISTIAHTTVYRNPKQSNEYKSEYDYGFSLAGTSGKWRADSIPALMKNSSGFESWVFPADTGSLLPNNHDYGQVAWLNKACTSSLSELRINPDWIYWDPQMAPDFKQCVCDSNIRRWQYDHAEGSAAQWTWIYKCLP